MFERQRLSHILVYLFYFALALFITWPLATRMSTHLYGGFLTDAYQSARHVWWIKHALQTGQSLFFQPALGYPDGLQGTWIWANPLEYFPGWLFAFVLPINAAVNLMMLVQVALNGWAVFLLMRYLTGKHVPALLAGVIFMAYPAMHGRIYGGHMGVLALWPLVLYLYAAFHLQDSGKRGWYLVAALALMFSIAGNSTLLIYYVLPVAGMFLLSLLITRRWLWFRRALIASVCGGGLALSFLVPLALSSSNQYNLGASNAVTYSADLLAVVSPSFYNPLFDRFLEYPRRVLGLNLVEGIGYVGIVAFVLAMIGFWRQKAARWWLLVVLIAWIGSLGPLLKVFDQPVRMGVDGYETYITLPWAFLQNLPIFDISRTSGRFNLTIGLAIAVLSGYGAAYLWGRFRRWRWISLVIIGVVILFEYQVFWGFPTDEAAMPQAVSDLAARDDIRAVYNIPWDHPILAKIGLYSQIYHGQNILTGQFIRDTPVNPAKLSMLQDTLDPALLDAAGVDVILWHKEFSPQADQLRVLTREQLGEPTYEDMDIAIFEVPQAAAPAGFTTTMLADQSIDTRSSNYFYAPASGWVTFSGVFSGRDMMLYMDDQPLNAFTITDETSITLWIPVTEAGFHTLRIELELGCPRIETIALRCNSLVAHNLTLTDFNADPPHDSVNFERGITLQGWLLGEDIQAGEVLPIALWWGFEQPPADDASRLLHVIDEAGNLIVQGDSGLTANAIDMPQVRLPDDLSPGTYRVYTGWYTYPSLVRYVADTPDNLVLLGTFDIEN